MKNYYYVILMSLLYSCIAKDSPDVIITNLSKQTIDSVKVYAIESLPTLFSNLESGKIKRGNILFDKKLLSTDGGYILEIYNKGKLEKTKPFGYFTNGSSLNNRFEIIIEHDTILIKYN